MRSNKPGFTLIELLIVVAIIAILAAIAVPNFLEAQTRSKVSRVKADLRSMATAIEAYTVDNNKPPREYYSGGIWGDPEIVTGQTVRGIMFPGNTRTHGLSTPIAYITNAWLTDPFVQIGENLRFDEKIFTYQNLYQRDPSVDPRVPSFSAGFATAARSFYGNWRLGSIGPDRDLANNLVNPGVAPFSLSAQLVYDPTNGTVSAGNIWRSQNRSDSDQPPVGPLLGAH